MKTKIPFKWSLLVIGIAGSIYSILFIIVLTPTTAIQNSVIQTNLMASAETALETVVTTTGMQLRIPSIDIDAIIESVGLTSEGLMDVPKDPNNAAWYNLGPLPGSVGTSVIDGHSGSKDDIPAVFDNLYKLKKGDEIYVENEKGGTSTFIVREVKIYDANASISEVFNSNDTGAHLNLITCIGDWNELEKTRFSRLVVFADKTD